MRVFNGEPGSIFKDENTKTSKYRRNQVVE